MTKIAHLTTGLVAGALLTSFTFAISSKAIEAQDPTKLAPQFYKLVLDNAHVRVIDFRESRRLAQIRDLHFSEPHAASRALEAVRFHVSDLD